MKKLEPTAQKSEDKSDQIKDGSLKELVRGIIRSNNLSANDEKQFIKEIETQFVRETRQAFCKALGKRNHELKEYIIKKVLETNERKTAEDIALDYSPDRTHVQEVTKAMQELLAHNILRIRKDRTLDCYNGMVKVVIMKEMMIHRT